MHGIRRPARLIYGPAQFDVVVPGDYVACAVTRRQIPLADLRYWNVERQEAYADPLTALQANQAKGG